MKNVKVVALKIPKRNNSTFETYPTFSAFKAFPHLSNENKLKYEKFLCVGVDSSVFDQTQHITGHSRLTVPSW